MLFKTQTLRRHFHARSALLSTPNPNPNPTHYLQCSHISSLKVSWRKDPQLDHAIEADKRCNLVARVVKEVLNEPGQSIPLRYLENRRHRLRLNVKARTFLAFNPNLFLLYRDRIKPKADLVPFVRPSERLLRFLDDERRIHSDNEAFVVSKLCKLLMMSNHRALSAEKLAHVKRVFGFPNDFLTRLVPKYPECFRRVGCGGEGRMFLELVSWNPSYAKSVVERKAEEETAATGVRTRPNFDYKLPRGVVLRKEMREWVRDWLELEYVSPYSDVSGIDRASAEMEKRRVGVLHEVVSLSVCKRVAVPTLGKFGEEFGLSNAFASAFTRHPGIFYMSLKGGIETAVLREAYEDGVLVDRGDPLLEIKDKFAELVEEGWQERRDELRKKNECRKTKAMVSE